MRTLTQTTGNIGGTTHAIRPSRERVPTLRMEPSNTFILSWKPSGWDVFEGTNEILPSLTKMYSEPGTHGVVQGSHIADHESNISRKLGCKFITEDECGQAYNVAYRVPMGKVYLAPWETVRDGSETPRMDIKTYSEFCSNLYERGIITMPSPDEVEDRIFTLQEKLDKLESKPVRNTADINLVKHKMKVLRSYLEPEPETQPEVVEAPKKSKA